MAKKNQIDIGGDPQGAPYTTTPDAGGGISTTPPGGDTGTSTGGDTGQGLPGEQNVNRGHDSLVNLGILDANGNLTDYGKSIYGQGGTPPVDTGGVDGPGPGSLPEMVAPPNTPTSLPGTFALPGSSGSAPYRSQNYAMNRGLGADVLGAAGRRKKFGAGSALSTQSGALSSAEKKPKDYADQIAAFLAGR
jgi:hypothetical protein